MAFLANLRFGLLTLSLGRTATAASEKVRELQQRRFRRILRLAAERSKFYRKLYQGVNLDECDVRDLPVVDKAMLMENFDDVITNPELRLSDLEQFVSDEANIGKYYKENYVVSHTSGSQGQPLILVQHKDQVRLLFALQASRGNDVNINLLEALQRRLDRARLAVVSLKRGWYPSAAAFEYMPESAQSYVKLLRLSGLDEDLIEKLNEFKPTHLTAYASMLQKLADAADAGRLNLDGNLQQVVNNSEMLTPGVRKRFEETFNVRVLDNYATGECPFLSNGCRTGPGMHVNADWCLFEVVDDDYNPVPDGDSGKKVLVTNLANRVQPIIRYEVGDVVTMATTGCECGSNLPRIERIGGRASEIFQIRSGDRDVELTPILFQHALEYFLDVREWQVVQCEDRNRFTVKVQPISGKTIDAPAIAQRIEKELAEHGMGGMIEFDIEKVDRLEPDPKTKKFYRAITA